MLARQCRHVLLVGGGAGGVESLLSVERRLRHDAPTRAPRFTLAASSASSLPAFPPAFRVRFHRVIVAHGVTLRVGTRVTRVNAAGVHLANGRIGADEAFWTTKDQPGPVARWDRTGARSTELPARGRNAARRRAR